MPTLTGLPKVVGIGTSAPPIFQHPVARDLAWLILNPALIQPGKYRCLAESHRHGDFAYDFVIPSSRWQARAWHAFAPVLAQGKQITPALDRLHASKHKQRLGLYFERLMYFWLTHSPLHEVIAKGLSVRQFSNKSTLGECDYLVFDKSTQQLQHWEVAVKFYLGVSYKNATEKSKMAWLGPNLKDRLDLKIHHTLNHQLPLSASAEAQLAFDALMTGNSTTTLSTAAQRAIMANSRAYTAPVSMPIKSSGARALDTQQQPDKIVRVLWIKGALYQSAKTDPCAPKTLHSPEPEILGHLPVLPINPLAQRGHWYTTPSPAGEYDFHMGLPRLSWLGHRNAKEIFSETLHNDSTLSKHHLPTPRPVKKNSLQATQNFHATTTAQHRATFCKRGTMLSRFFYISPKWHLASMQHLNASTQ